WNETQKVLASDEASGDRFGYSVSLAGITLAVGAPYEDDSGTDDNGAVYHVTLEPDRDVDGVPDDTDNCPDDANADQANQDGDASGDVCDICPEDATDAL